MKSLEELMVKAIRQFKREHRTCSIRTCAFMEGSGAANEWTAATVEIEYVEEDFGEYKTIDIRVEA